VKSEQFFIPVLIPQLKLTA